MKALPEGKSLGWMQAPASWIGSHTVRFVGVVRIVIQDGEGCILIKKGKPLFYYFKQGTIELKGHTALDYFNSHPVIEFNLCKYSPDELAWAMKLCNVEDPDHVVQKEPAASGPVSREHNPHSHTVVPPVEKPVQERKIPDTVVVPQPVPAITKGPAASGPVSREHKPPSQSVVPPVEKPVHERKIPDTVVVPQPVPTVTKGPAASGPVSREHNPSSHTVVPSAGKSVQERKIPDTVMVPQPVPTVTKGPAVSGPVSREHKPPSHTVVPPVEKPVQERKIPEVVVVPHPVPTVEEQAVAPLLEADEDPEVTILSQIRNLNGIVALAVFNDTGTVITMSDEDSEAMVKIARTMLVTAGKMTPRLPWGPFVHMTIQIPSGNMIIAPYHDNYLCLLTTRAINIGHIRRILRDLVQKGANQRR
jgi:predicted regulator of Ras-like GTPase activity (Roadblock/LC7/MglB family)